MACYPNAKHVDWNSLLKTRRWKLHLDYANLNSCLLFGTNIATTNTYSSTIHDVLGILMAKDIPLITSPANF